MKGEEIKLLIPQRFPVMMVDEFVATGECSAETRLAVRPDNYFVYANGELSESGLIEHVAQSASALAGSRMLTSGGGRPPIGILGEIRHFASRRRARTGELLHTCISFGLSFGPATMVTGTTWADDEEIAETELKIFIQ